MRVIDVHGHLGDILYSGGGSLIFKTGIKFPRSVGLQALDEKYLFRDGARARIYKKLFPGWETRVERKRNAAATLENLQASLETGTGATIERCVCLPVAPHNIYADIRAAAEVEPRIVAFTSPDFSAENMEQKLEADLKDGAAGLKIHPIIQGVEADSPEIIRASEIASVYGAPVLLHSGRASYYTRREGREGFRENASIVRLDRLVAAVPAAKFIIAHAGLGQIAEVLDLLCKHKNAYVDTSFQPPEAIRVLISAFGAERVLFGSDWPYADRRAAVLAAREACADDAGLLEAVFYANAAAILRL